MNWLKRTADGHEKEGTALRFAVPEERRVKPKLHHEAGYRERAPSPDLFGSEMSVKLSSPDSPQQSGIAVERPTFGTSSFGNQHSAANTKFSTSSGEVWGSALKPEQPPAWTVHQHPFLNALDTRKTPETVTEPEPVRYFCVLCSAVATAIDQKQPAGSYCENKNVQCSRCAADHQAVNLKTSETVDTTASIDDEALCVAILPRSAVATLRPQMQYADEKLSKATNLLTISTQSLNQAKAEYNIMNNALKEWTTFLSRPGSGYDHSIFAHPQAQSARDRTQNLYRDFEYAQQTFDRHHQDRKAWQGRFNAYNGVLQGII